MPPFARLAAAPGLERSIERQENGRVAEISAKAVKSLREQTGAGMMDCKRALSEADGNIERERD